MTVPSITDELVTIHILYKPTTQAEDPRAKFNVITNGWLAPGTILKIPAAGTLETDMTFFRRDLGKDLVINITVISKGRPLIGSSITLPPNITLTYALDQRSEKCVSETSLATCGGNGDWHPTIGADKVLDVANCKDKFPPMTMAAGDKANVDYYFDMSTFAAPVVPHVSGDGIGGCGTLYMDIVQPSDLSTTPVEGIKTIVGHVHCVTGPRKDNFCDASGQLQALPMRKVQSLHKPSGKGERPQSVQASESENNLDTIDDLDTLSVYQIGPG